MSSGELVKLYRTSLKAAQQFETYNFRKYFYRRTHDRFRELASSSKGSEQADRLLDQARSELQVMKRQGLINRMYAHNLTAIEADPAYSKASRRPNSV